MRWINSNFITEYPVRLEKAGFKDISQTAFAAVDYNPDNWGASREKLQMLRDKGFIEFLGNGRYRKVVL